MKIGLQRKAPGWTLRSVALLGVLAVLLGVLELHPAAGGHVLGVDAERVYLCADKDPRSLHVEVAQSLEREHCPGCLHRLQTAGAEASEPAGSGALAVSAAVPSVLPAHLIPGSPSPTRSRGPPL